MFAFSLVKLNGSLLTGISSPTYDRRESHSPLGDDGTLHQTGDGVIRAAPMARFTTKAIRALFIALGTTGQVPFVALDGTNGIELIGTKISTTAPGYDATSVHASRKGPKGELYLKSLRYSPGDVAEAECEAFFFSSAGGTDPITVATVALPTLAANTEQLVLSALTIGATPITKLRSFEVSIDHRGENNVQDHCYDSGLPFPVLTTKAGVNGQTEIIVTIETTDLTTSYANGTVTAAFTVVNNLGIGLAATTATMTINGSIVREDAISGAKGQAGGRRISIRGTFDGTNRPCTIATV